MAHDGRYDILPFDPAVMEWVPTSRGLPPPGRRAVEGGYEKQGDHLWHAKAWIEGVEVPGKTGAHLKGANFAYAGVEHVYTENYEILCWR